MRGGMERLLVSWTGLDWITRVWERTSVIVKMKLGGAESYLASVMACLSIDSLHFALVLDGFCAWRAGDHLGHLRDSRRARCAYWLPS